MKKIASVLVVLFLTVNVTLAQNVKNLVHDANAEIRKVKDFDAIEVSSAITVYLSQGNENAVAISTDEGGNNNIKTEVKNNVLKIYPENDFLGKWNCGDRKIKAYITIQSLKKLYAGGACKVVLTEKLKADDLKIELGGASFLKGEINASTLSLSLGGASTITINGTANNLEISAYGASNVKAYDLLVNTCSADANGASNIKVNVAKEFSHIHASGASSIHYKGDAVIKDFESSGASSIKKEN